MKKIVSLLLLITMLFAFSGCNAPKEKEGYKIVTSFYPVMLITKMAVENIDGVYVSNLASADTGCLHDYALVPDDLKNLETADMFVINGLGMESFTDKITGRMPNLDIVDLSSGITPVNNNAHIWLLPENVITMLSNLCDSLTTSLPQHKESILNNKEKYISLLNQLDAEIKDQSENFKGTRVITCHEAFDYFAKEYNIEISGTIQREPGEEPSTKELIQTTNLIKEKGIKILLAEPQYSTTAADTLARETGAIVYMLDPIVTGNNQDSPDVYFEKTKNNLNILNNAIRKD